MYLVRLHGVLAGMVTRMIELDKEYGNMLETIRQKASESQLVLICIHNNIAEMYQRSFVKYNVIMSYNTIDLFS